MALAPNGGNQAMMFVRKATGLIVLCSGKEAVCILCCVQCAAELCMALLDAASGEQTLPWAKPDADWV